MSFHKTNLGSFGDGLPCDMEGYVPEEGDDPWGFTLDHRERTHDEEGELTDYGQWWEDDGFPEWLASAVEATETAVEALSRWQQENG